MLEKQDAAKIVDKALDLGINFFDTSNVYSTGRSEEITGELLKEYRDDVVIATKVFFKMSEGSLGRGLSRFHIFDQIDASLKRLQTDHVDLYQIHRLDTTVGEEELMRSLNRVIDQGKTLHIGSSSMYLWQFVRLQRAAERAGLEGFATMQNHYNLVYREEEREMLPYCRSENIGVIPWSPLARGFLVGKYKRGEGSEHVRFRTDNRLKLRYFRDADFDVVEALVDLAGEKEVTPPQLSMAWLFHQDVASPILGATKVSHVEEAVEALEIRLDKDEIARLEEPYQAHPVIGHTVSVDFAL